MAEVGAKYRYQADAGLGARARIADPDVSDELPTEMHDLDMQPDTEVEVVPSSAHLLRPPQPPPR